MKRFLFFPILFFFLFGAATQGHGAEKGSEKKRPQNRMVSQLQSWIPDSQGLGKPGSAGGLPEFDNSGSRDWTIFKKEDQ
jgi:hypothetical protein